MTTTPAARPPRPTTLVVDLEAPANNIRAVRRMVGTVAEVARRHGLGLHHVATTVGARVARVYTP